MRTDVFWVALSALCGVAGLSVSVLAFRGQRSETLSKRRIEQIRQVVQAELAEVIARQTDLSNQLANTMARQTEIRQALQDQASRTGTILDRLTALETKMEVFWRSVAMDAAKIIHSPDPRRAHVDALLEAFMNGTLSPGDEQDLRAILENIRDWEPGNEHTGFPVYPGEQIAAAILLRTMHATISSRGR